MLLNGRRVLLMLLTTLRDVTAGYHVDVPIDTPIGAAVTAIIMTLIVVGVLSYFYHRLKEPASAAGKLQSHWRLYQSQKRLNCSRINYEL